MSADVQPRLRDKVDCPCGCGAFGVIVKRTGHVKGCRDDCVRCARRTSSNRSRPRDVPEPIRRQVAVRAKGRCEASIEGVCTGIGEHAHHVRRRSQGGTDSVGNLRWVCSADHRWIHDHPAEAVELGLLERTEASA